MDDTCRETLRPRLYINCGPEFLMIPAGLAMQADIMERVNRWQDLDSQIAPCQQ